MKKNGSEVVATSKDGKHLNNGKDGGSLKDCAAADQKAATINQWTRAALRWLVGRL